MEGGLLQRFFLFAPLVCSTFLQVSYSYNVTSEETPETPPVLVFLIESFRWDFVYRIRYLSENRGRHSTLWSMVEEGAYASEGIFGVFSTGTFPNQYTLATGLYPESHGVVSNSTIHDPILNQTADLQAQKPENAWVLGGEPIWSTLTKHGTGQNSSNASLVACYGWFGCGYAGGVAYIESEMGVHPWDHRVDTVVGWLKESFKLILVSYPDFGSLLRSVGPNSTAADEALMDIDDKIGYFMNRLKVEGFYDQINLIILGDQGVMNAVDEKPVLPKPEDLPSYFEVRSRDSTVCLVDPALGSEDETIRYFHEHVDHVQTFRQQELPTEWHYKNNSRISPIVVTADPGYSFNGGKGISSFNSSLTDMRPAFIGHGPAFVPNSTVPSSVSTVDIYGLMSHLLNITAAPNNGSEGQFEQFLRHKRFKPRLHGPAIQDNFTFFVIVIVLAIALVLGVLIMGWLCHTSNLCRSNEADTEAVSYLPSEVTPLIPKNHQ